MAAREIEMLSGLVRAVSNLEANRQNQSRRNPEESIEGVMTGLFPSRGGRVRQNSKYISPTILAVKYTWLF